MGDMRAKREAVRTGGKLNRSMSRTGAILKGQKRGGTIPLQAILPKEMTKVQGFV